MPWEFWQENCLRTIRNQWIRSGQTKNQFREDWFPHYALHDAAHQAMDLQMMNSCIEIGDDIPF